MAVVSAGAGINAANPISTFFESPAQIMAKVAVGVGTATSFTFRDTSSSPWSVTATGTGFSAYTAYGMPTTGTADSFTARNPSGATMEVITGASISMAALAAAIAANDHDGVQNAVLGGNDTLNGSAFGDELYAWNGDDTITGGGGNDEINGGAGFDTAIYAGASTNYTVLPTATGWTVTDRRAVAVDGVDTLAGIERITFSDKSVSLQAPVAGNPVAAPVNNILRLPTSGTTNFLINNLSDQIAAGDLTLSGAVSTLIVFAKATTSVATTSYAFFTGKIPTAGGMDYLVSPTGPNANNLNSTYYQSFSLENRYINFAVNLGKVGEGKDAFTAAFGGMDLFTATKAVYGLIFGAIPSDTKVHALLDPTFVLGGVTMTRSEYFAYYGGDGPNGIGTKAAMVGWLLGEAIKADLGMYAKANTAFLTDLADGATFNVDLVGVYGKPEYIYNPG